MIGRNVSSLKGARFRGLAVLTLAALGLPGFTSCARKPEPGPSKEVLWKQLYESRLENLRMMDQAFNTIGEEYSKLEIEYKNSGRDDLAAISRERAKAFNDQHLAFQKKIADLAAIDARIRRGEPAAGIEDRTPSQAPAAAAPIIAPEPAVQAAQPMSSPGASTPGSTQYSPPSSAGYVRPAQTPTPSPSGLNQGTGRFGDPIIITDPRANNR